MLEFIKSVCIIDFVIFFISFHFIPLGWQQMSELVKRHDYIKVIGVVQKKSMLNRVSSVSIKESVSLYLE